jgi:hypothetical protein
LSCVCLRLNQVGSRTLLPTLLLGMGGISKSRKHPIIGLNMSYTEKLLMLLLLWFFLDVAGLLCLSSSVETKALWLGDLSSRVFPSPRTKRDDEEPVVAE